MNFYVHLINLITVGLKNMSLKNRLLKLNPQTLLVLHLYFKYHPPQGKYVYSPLSMAISFLFYRSVRMSHQNKPSLEVSCLSVESRTQECVKIESHFDNGIV